jgi:hypothetical protein
VIIKSIELGDVFTHENGGKIQVKQISCAYDEQEKRWETSIGYNVIPKNPSYSTLANFMKAREFVLMIQEQGPVGQNFVTQISGSAVSTPTSVTPVTASPSGSGNNVGTIGPSQIERDFRLHASRYGLHPTDLGREVTIAFSGVPRKYVIVGAKPRNHKYPILLRKLRNGTVYKFPADKVKSALV